MSETIGAIEAGGTKFVLAIADQSGKILARDRIATTTPQQTGSAVNSFFQASASEHGPIAGFGIGSFGPVVVDSKDPSYGTITTTPKPAWSGFRYHELLAGFMAPVLVETDVNAAALGEWIAGAGRGCASLAYTTVGTGVGTGILHGGAALSGFSHYEAGHIRIPHDRQRDPFGGSCPYHGDCLEGLVSGPAIAQRWGASLDRLGADEIAMIAEYLGNFAATLVLTHAPERLIFGGGVMKAPGLLAATRSSAEAAIAGYVTHPRLSPGLEDYIVSPQLGDDAGIAGAIELGRRAAAAR